jgi:crotonobetainyl-CoA:carnitine CoA-transferase CaiB-like acyl-CoA transferase
VVPKVEALMKRLTTAEWEQRLTEVNVPHAVVRGYADVFTDPQTLARGMKLTVRDPAGNPVDLIGSPLRFHGAAPPDPTMPPRLGAQTDAVLGELLGLDADAVRALRDKGVV